MKTISEQPIQSYEFMLNEYNTMKEFRELIIHQIDNRVNLYLKMVSTAITIIPAFSFWIVNSNDVVNFQILCLISGVITAVLMYFGILSFFRVMEGHISIIRYTRAINRVRRFFYDRDNAIRKYISMPVTDDLPIFGTYGFSEVKTMNVGATSLVMMLNTFNLLLLEGIALWYLNMQLSLKDCMLICSIVVAILLSVGYYLLLRYIYNKHMLTAKNKTIVHFPNQSTIYIQKN